MAWETEKELIKKLIQINKDLSQVTDWIEGTCSQVKQTIIKIEEKIYVKEKVCMCKKHTSDISCSWGIRTIEREIE